MRERERRAGPVWALYIVAVLAAGAARGQISPGTLSKAHQSLSGPTQCISCHVLAAGDAKFKCLGCHAEIRERLNAKRGLHSSMVKSVGTQQECIKCHSEHEGARFVPIRWDVDLSEFDHGKTGYVLEGGHRGLDCRKCHTAKHIDQSERRKIKVKDLNRTYLGLTVACLNCHEDQHHGQLSSDCVQCHTYAKWKPASRFDHARAKFQLTAAHEKLVCEKCHQKAGDGTPYAKFTGLSFATCDGCHKDPHRAAFPATCKSCHSETGWKPALTAASFDHGRTEFALTGKHSTLACGKCHRSADFKQPVAHARCVDCHATDVHGAQFAARADGGECSACHVVAGWKPTTFKEAAHRSTRFPLEGRHAPVPCAKCHLPAGKATVYMVKFGQCTDCHADQHKAQFAGPPYANRCQECHTEGGFEPSTFTLARHSTTRMPLAGAHSAVACNECHYDGGRAHGQPGRFRFADLSCTGCHEDPHKDQFRERMLAAGPDGKAQECQACHVPRTWRDVSKFDHSTTRFQLSGTHRGVPCEKCHVASQPGAGLKSVVFRSAATQCSGCHEDNHGGQFTTVLAAADCGQCHSPLQWTPASFTHDRQTGFSLTGAHRETTCRACHGSVRRVNGKNVVVYKPTPKECGGCHGPEVVG